jgi:hypothetical protein
MDDHGMWYQTYMASGYSKWAPDDPNNPMAMGYARQLAQPTVAQIDRDTEYLQGTEARYETDKRSAMRKIGGGIAAETLREPDALWTGYNPDYDVTMTGVDGYLREMQQPVPTSLEQAIRLDVGRRDARVATGAADGGYDSDADTVV